VPKTGQAQWRESHPGGSHVPVKDQCELKRQGAHPMDIQRLMDGIWGVGALVSGLHCIASKHLDISEDENKPMSVNGLWAISIGLVLVVLSVFLFASALGLTKIAMNFGH
jgi:hypothetical protein